MRTVSFAITTTFALSLAGAIACSPSTKNEEQYWTVHQAEVAAYGGRWPGFKVPLAAKLNSARPVWEAALAIGSDKEKAQKMHEANGLLADGLLARLGEVKYKSKTIGDTVDKINGLRIPASRAGERQAAVASAQRSVDEVERAMVAARPASEAEALQVLEVQISRLITDGGAADRAYTRLKPEPEKKKKK
jgi:hypothetical protein